uniref:Lipoprotein n=1 Tax=Heterorhabditis bacteriophora TaxID=37862 RepID=A0A1I7WDK7_HETBA
MVFLFLWISYAPAAFLGCGSSLSGVEPLFSVTRDNHGRLIDYHQVDRADTFSDYQRTSRRYSCVIQSQQTTSKDDWSVLIIAPLPKLGSRITAVIQKYYRINDICSNEPFAVSPLVEQYILLRKHINQSDKWVVTDNTRFSPVFPKPSKRFLTLPFNSCNFHEIPVHHQKFVGTIPARKFLAPVSKSNRITGQNHKSQILSWSDTTIFTNHPSNHRKFTFLRDNTNLLYWPQPVKSQSTIPFNTVIATNGCYE